MTAMVLHGDCLDFLPHMMADSADAVVTDPPYELGFMSKSWDRTGIAFRPETWALVARVMKPGAYMVAFSGTRTYHRMVCAIEDAGFIIHPMIGWLFGTGFPKAHRVEAEGWEDWRYGLQSLKPALEPICLAQKPMRERTGTAQVLATGTGALNIGACRVPTEESTRRCNHGGTGNPENWRTGNGGDFTSGSDAGRWPANLCWSVPEDEYLLKEDVTPEQKRELYGWLSENA